MTLSKDALIADRRFPEADVEVPSLAGTVRVRALSRGEVFGVQKLKGVDEQERKILSLGMLEPRLTVAEVQRWQEVSPAEEIEPVVAKIHELSGSKKESEKEVVLDFRGESEPGV